MKAIHLKTLVIIFILLGTTSCNIIKLNIFTRPANDDKLHYNSKLILIDSNNITHYECEKFVLNALEDYTIASMKEYNFLNYSKEPAINIHNSSIIDTIYTFENKKNTIRIYRALHKDFVYMFDVTNSKFMLIGNIKPGMSKAAFSQIFQITEPINKEVQLANSDSTIKYLFYFNKNTLKRITANSYLD